MSELPSDMLEELIINLPTIDLLSVSCVATDWLQAVRSSLLRQPRVFPWLVLRCLRHPKSSSYSFHALDPYSITWLSITCHNTLSQQPFVIPHFLSGFNGSRLYTLSPSNMAVFKDPFGNACQMASKGPKVWRQDPVVAEVSQWIVVAGGCLVADLNVGEEEGAVVVFDKSTDKWELAEPMPWKFDGSTYATWLSVAASETRLYVIEKKTGWMSCFDPESKKWGHTSKILPEQPVSSWSIATVGKERLLLVGTIMKEESQKRVMKVRLWEVDGDSLQITDNKSEEMPAEIVNCLFPDFGLMDDTRQRACSVQVYGTERRGYIFDPANMKNGVVMYQLSMERAEGRMVEKWEWIPCPATVKDIQMEAISVGCSSVTLNELARCFV